MGQRGPAKEPTELKLIKGNPGKKKLPANEPKPVAGTPKCPAHLGVEAKREWKRITKELRKLGLLTLVDRAALAAYCQTWQRWVEAEKMVSKEGLTVEGPRGGLMAHPAVTIANNALTQMHRFLREFGLSPSSRTGIEVPKKAASLKERLKAKRGKKT